MKLEASEIWCFEVGSVVSKLWTTSQLLAAKASANPATQAPDRRLFNCCPRPSRRQPERQRYSFQRQEGEVKMLSSRRLHHRRHLEKDTVSVKTTNTGPRNPHIWNDIHPRKNFLAPEADEIMIQPSSDLSDIGGQRSRLPAR